MEPIRNDAYNLLDFLLKFALVYIPCVIGAICGVYFKHHYLPNKSNKNKKQITIIGTINFSLSSSIVPSIIILLAEYLLPDTTPTNHIIKYGISMLFGFIGSDRITEYLMNMSNLFKVLKAISEGMNGLSKLSEDNDINAIDEKVSK